MGIPDGTAVLQRGSDQTHVGSFFNQWWTVVQILYHETQGAISFVGYPCTMEVLAEIVGYFDTKVRVSFSNSKARIV